MVKIWIENLGFPYVFFGLSLKIFPKSPEKLFFFFFLRVTRFFVFLIGFYWLQQLNHICSLKSCGSGAFRNITNRETRIDFNWTAIFHLCITMCTLVMKYSWSVRRNYVTDVTGDKISRVTTELVHQLGASDEKGGLRMNLGGKTLTNYRARTNDKICRFHIQSKEVRSEFVGLSVLVLRCFHHLTSCVLSCFIIMLKTDRVNSHSSHCLIVKIISKH